MTNQPKRRRGAPLGNTNALKHGFYTKRNLQTHPAGLTANAINDIQNYQFSGLEEEIATLRVYIRRLLEISPEEANLDQITSLLHILNLSFFNLTRLLRFSRQIKRDQTFDLLHALHDGGEAALIFAKARMESALLQNEEDKKEHKNASEKSTGPGERP